ncbi:MAG: LamG domain-containing protein [Bacteroidetes bacterium]|nr:LamG domain-containing protein [Bacteroidota bacterium]
MINWSKLVIIFLCFFPIIFSGCKNPATNPILQTGKVQINLETTVGSKGRTGSFSKAFVFITIRKPTGEKVLSNFKVQLLREGSWFASIPVSLPAGSYLIDPVVFWDEAETLLLEFSAPPRFFISPNQLITLKTERGSVVRTSLKDSLEKILDENPGGASIQLSVKALNNQTDSLFFVDGTLLKSIDGTPVSLTYLTRETQKNLIPRDSKPKTVSFTIKSPDYKDTTLVCNISENEILRTRSAEIQLEPINPIKKQLLVWYPLDGNAKDHSGNNHHGKANKVTFIPDRFGKINGAVKLNKESNIFLGDVFNTVDVPFVINFWIRTNYAKPVVRRHSINQIFGFEFCVLVSDFLIPEFPYYGFKVNYSNGFFNFQLGDGAGLGFTYRKTVISNKFVADGKWHMVTGVFKSFKDMKIFIDSRPAFQPYLNERVNGKAVRLVHSSLPAVIGVGMTGELDDLKIYNYALTEAQIDSLYHEGGWK